jgi:hypothetical protein
MYRTTYRNFVPKLVSNFAATFLAACNKVTSVAISGFSKSPNLGRFASQGRVAGRPNAASRKYKKALDNSVKWNGD